MYRNVMLSVLLAAVVVFGGVHRADAQQRQGTVSVQVDLKAPEAAKRVRLWIPYPMSDKNQDITDVSVRGNFAAMGVYREPKDGVTALYAEWTAPARERKLTYTFTVSRKEVAAGQMPGIGGPLPVNEVKQYLDNSGLGDARERVDSIAAGITKGKKTVLEKARAVYDWVVDTMRRDPDVKGCGLAEIDRLLSTKAGKCADISSVYVALCRAAGVPARVVHGIRMPTFKEGDITKYQHCWAEFYLSGYGWVTVDPADVLKYKLEKNPTATQLEAKREYFFGAVDDSRIALNRGDHVLLNPRQSGAPLPYFMYPYAEADGKPLNEDLYGFNMGYRITFSAQ